MRFNPWSVLENREGWMFGDRWPWHGSGKAVNTSDQGGVGDDCRADRIRTKNRTSSASLPYCEY